MASTAFRTQALLSGLLGWPWASLPIEHAVAQVSAPTASAHASRIQWEQAPHNNWDRASQVTVNGKPYLPESAEKPYSIQIAKNTTSDLTRVEVRDGDLWTSVLGGDDTERAELDGFQTTFPAGKDIWFAYDLLVENGPSPWVQMRGGYPGASVSWLVLGQIHGKGEAIATPFSLSGVGERLSVILATQTEGPKPRADSMRVWQDTYKIERNKVYHVVGRLKVMGVPGGAGGECDVWIDGKNVVTYRGNLGDGDRFYYFKYGVYRGWQNNGIPDMAFQFANVVVGSKSLLSRTTQPLPWPSVK